MAASADDHGGYSWETEYEKTWEAIREDESGSLQTAITDLVHLSKRRKMLDRPRNIRLGMMRHMYIILDLSSSMSDVDFRPSRLACCTKLLENFASEYFDQNPISQLGIIVTKNRRATKVTELDGNIHRHTKALRDLALQATQGEPSLQNGLELAHATLKNMPGHTSKELLVLFSSLTTCDPGNITETILKLKHSGIRSSVIALSAELSVCSRLAKTTGGTFCVALDNVHLHDLLISHVTPPPVKSSQETSLVKMGFPQKEVGGMPGLCMCHLEENKLSVDGYFCPQCRSKYCHLPIECKVCGLMLVLAPHIARSHHHLFPLSMYDHVSLTVPISCCGCTSLVLDKAYKCTHCSQLFCIDCDLFIHESLHSCPGCESGSA